jgi:hypothetical protein
MVHEPLCRVLRGINPYYPAKSILAGGEYPKVNKPPTPNIEDTATGSSKPPRLGDAQNTPGAGGTPSYSTWPTLSPNSVGAPFGLKLAESPKTFPTSPGHMDSRPSVGTILVKALLCLAKRNNHGNICRLQSHLPITLSRVYQSQVPHRQVYHWSHQHWSRLGKHQSAVFRSEVCFDSS